MQTLAGKLDEITQRHRMDDQHFLFGANGSELQISVLNQSEVAIEDAAISLMLPHREDLHVADQPLAEGARYPSVDIREDLVLVTDHAGEIPPGVPVPALQAPVTVCAGQSLAGRRVTVAYTLFGRNLRTPVRGQLTIEFRDDEALKAG